MTPFERALAGGGNLVAAWDYEDTDTQRLVLCSVGSDGAQQVAETDVPAETRQDLVDRLVARGVRVGGTYAGSDFAWVADDTGFAVWTKTSCVAEGTRPKPDVARVHVWIDETNAGHRGVRFDLHDGGTRPIVEENRSSAKLLTYGEDDLYLETLWAHYLGLHLALWHGVELVNDISSKSIEADLAVRRGSLELAARLNPQSKEVSVNLGSVSRASELVIYVSAAGDDAARTLGIRAKASGSSTTLTRTIKRGTLAQVSAFLRRVTTPSAVLTAMNVAINEANAG